MMRRVIVGLAWFFQHRWTRYVVCWLIALGLAGWRWHESRYGWYDPRRPITEGQAHTYIDFAGQWVMGRLLVEGKPRDLFMRPVQWELVYRSFPREHEPPNLAEHDAERLMRWFIGGNNPATRELAVAVVTPLAADSPWSAVILSQAATAQFTLQRLAEHRMPQDRTSVVGGPLYPPIHAFVMAPLALEPEPYRAFRIWLVLLVVLAFVAGAGVSYLSQGRIWAPIASALILLFPGFRTGLDIGQNAILTLAIVVWGWACLVRGREKAGGIIWGLLCFKPIWGVSFFLVPLLLRRYRFCLSMVLTGNAIALATVPVVGVQVWQDWLQVGNQAAYLYDRDHNWVLLSRDIYGFPRKVMIDFNLPLDERERPEIFAACLLLWATIMEVTIRVYALRQERELPLTGPLPAFLFLTAHFCCFHFMFYDTLLASMSFILLAARPRELVTPWTCYAEGAGIPAPLPQPRETIPPLPTRPQQIRLFNSCMLTTYLLLVLWDTFGQGSKLAATVQCGHFLKEVTNSAGEPTTSPKGITIGVDLFYAWETVMLLPMWFVLAGRLLVERPKPNPSALLTIKAL